MTTFWFKAGSGTPSIILNSGKVIDCTNCPCGVIVPGCSNPISTTLHLSLTQAACPCVTSGTIVLNWNSGTQKWTGTGAFGTCGENITVSIYTDSGGTWYTDISFSNGCMGPVNNQPIATTTAYSNFTFNGGFINCNPFELQYALSSTNALCGCDPSFIVTFTITQ